MYVHVHWFLVGRLVCLLFSIPFYSHTNYTFNYYVAGESLLFQFSWMLFFSSWKLILYSYDKFYLSLILLFTEFNLVFKKMSGFFYGMAVTIIVIWKWMNDHLIDGVNNNNNTVAHNTYTRRTRKHLYTQF